MTKKCYVWGCDSGQNKANLRYDAAGETRPCMFKAPRDEVLRAKWGQKIPRKDRSLGPNDHVCEHHFYPDDIITHNIIKLKDGSTFKAPTVPHIREGCLPSRFPGPKYLSQEAPRRRPPPKDRNETPCKKRKMEKELTQTVGKESSAEPCTSNSTPGQDGSTPPPLHPEEKNEQDETCNLHEPLIAPESLFDIPYLKANAKEVALPDSMWSVYIKNDKIGFVHNSDNFQTDKIVVFSDSMQPEITISHKTTRESEIKSRAELEELLRKIQSYSVCIGANDNGARASQCIGYVVCRAKKLPLRCGDCRSERRRLQKKKSKSTSITEKVLKLTKKNRTMGQKNRRLEKQVDSLKKQVKQYAEECKNLQQQTINEAIATLPEEQQELVQNIFKAAKCKSTRGRRYRRQYVFECMLMRVKGHGLYKKLKRENKLPLPSEQTLDRYMKALQPEYGFQENTFSIMKRKAPLLSEDERHGCLLLDEMQLDANLSFKRDTLEVHGMVDLGTHTTEEDKQKRGDHGLVIMFQPFKGQWVQTIGAFLGAGAVPGKTLEKLVLEAVILLNNNGYFVDMVTTDGAKWNRSMWSLVGVNKTASSCVHPCDPERRLWYGSDFPHLIKCLWARITTKKELIVPEGVIKLKHWQCVVDYNKGFAVKQCFTINDDHLSPTNYQKMNVQMAFRFFGESVAVAMEHLKDVQKMKQLQDSLPTIKFIRRINTVIDAMNSNNSFTGLRADPTSENNKVLNEFLTYLISMDDMAAERKRLAAKKKTRKTKKSEEKVNVGAADEITTETFLGLIVTVRAALELIQYLHERVGFEYLMTKRLNQDALEHFFGKVRSSCGSGSHPDPLLFIQIYRLLSTYSLVKPPRGSNVQGGELLKALVEMKDLFGEKKKARKAELEDKIDNIIDLQFPDFPEEEQDLSLSDHTYLAKPVDPFALTVFGGYISRKVRKTNPAKSCNLCYEAVCAPDESAPLQREQFLERKSKGGLLKPSEEMYEVIYQIEEAIVRTIATQKLHTNTLFSILDELQAKSAITSLGCPEHKEALTAGIISFYLVCRMHFVCREANREIVTKKKKLKNMAKLAKLETTI